MKVTPVTADTKLGFIKGILLFIFALCILPACLFAFRRPAYNWDMLAYMAIVLKADHPAWKAEQVHKATYDVAREKIPPKEYGYLIQSDYQEKMLSDPAAFHAQLPFYTVKPLYTSLVYFFYKTGISLPLATVLPSILGYFLMGLLLCHWLSNYFKPLVAVGGALLLMYSPMMILVARISTPDAISSFLMLAAFYFIIEKPSVLFIFLFLLLSIFARLDNIITCFIILSFLFFSRKWHKQISLTLYTLMIIILIVSYFVVTLVTVKPFGWNILYYSTFTHYFNLSYTFHEAFSLKAYLALLYSHAITTAVFYHFTVFTFLALIVALPILHSSHSKVVFGQWFSVLLIFIILIRFILYPNITDRFYISFYLCILVLLARKYVKGIEIKYVQA